MFRERLSEVVAVHVENVRKRAQVIKRIAIAC